MDQSATPPAAIPPAATAPATTPTAHAGSSAPVASTSPRLSIWHRPVSYRVQCWVAWVGLTAFGARGIAAMSSGATPDLERLIAVALSVVWGIDLLRARSAEH